MTKHIKILFLILLTGCSFMYVDRRPFSETSWTIEQAKRYRHDIPLNEQAPLFEDATWRFYDRGAWTTELRRGVPRGYADVSCYLGRLLAAMSFKYAWEVRHYGQATPETELRLRQVFDAIEMLCNISGIPGFVSRGCRHKNTPYNEKPEHLWRAGVGKYVDYCYRGDGASPPQLVGATLGLQMCWLLGPDEYKLRIRIMMEDICLRLILHDFQIIGLDGLPTKVSEFDPRDTLLLVGSPFTGYLGLYLVYAALPGGKTIYGVMTGNRAARNLSLFQILRAGAIITENPLIRSEYMRLCREGYAKRTVLAGVNFFGIFNAGDELPKFDSWMCLLWPEWRDALPDAEYQGYYWAGMQRVWPWVKDMPTLATAQYCFLRDELHGNGLQELLDMLNTFPYPNCRRTIVNSNNPALKLYPWAQLDKSPEPLTTSASILPYWQRKATAYPGCRDPRAGLDSSGDGSREFSYMYFLYTYWFCKWCGYL